MRNSMPSQPILEIKATVKQMMLQPLVPKKWQKRTLIRSLVNITTVSGLTVTRLEL